MLQINFAQAKIVWLFIVIYSSKVSSTGKN